jgi:hypothetical protein
MVPAGLSERASSVNSVSLVNPFQSLGHFGGASVALIVSTYDICSPLLEFYPIF